MTNTTSSLSGNFTAVSSDAELMKSFSRLQKDVDLLSAEMSDVIRLRYDVGRRGQPQMDINWDINWLSNVRAREVKVVELQKKFNEIRRCGGTNLKACHELNKEVIVCLKAVVHLKREANHNVVAHRVADSAIWEGSVLHNEDSSSRSFKTVLKHLSKNGTISFSPSELRSYTSGFSTALGDGGSGVVYRGQFPNGMLFAVKLLHKHLTDKSVSSQFLAEVGTMGRTYHRNLVRVYGYCFHDSMKAVVYEYMEKGSLDKLMKNTKLEWRKMYNVVTDTAKGLSYLHENCHHRIIHLDIKPANVLIDSDFCSKISDYGLAKQYRWSLSHVTLTDLKGTYGYMAPELCLDFSSQGTSKCDVYSFGMLLFKVLESKKKGESQKWFPAEVFKKFKEGELKEFLINDCGIEEIDREDATKLVLVALCCIQYNPLDRPSMSTVVKTLEGEIQARVPPNLLLPQMFSSGVASRTFADENKYMLSSSIIRDGATCFKLSVPSEISPTSVEHVPIELPKVDFEKKVQENKDIKPLVKKDEVTTVVLRVGMHCEDCALKITKILVKMEGVLTADADRGNSLVTVKCVIDDPNKLVDYIWKKNNKRAVIVKTEPEKKQEEKDVEVGKKKDDKKEEGVDILTSISKKKIKELGIVEKKSEGNGAAEIKLMNKDEEKQGIWETRSEAVIKLKKKVEEIRIPNTEQKKEEEKAKAELRIGQEGSREEKRRQSEKKLEGELGRVKTKLVDCDWETNKKRTAIVKTEPDKKQNEKDVEQGKKKEDKKEGVDILKSKSIKKREEELDTVKNKSKGKGTAEIKPIKKDEASSFILFFILLFFVFFLFHNRFFIF